MSTNTTGPAELRRIADALDEQSAVFSSAGWIVITNTTDVRQQAAAWDADRAALAMYSKIDGDDGLASANRLLAACERGDGIDQHAAPDIMAARAEIVAQRAALERAANYLMLSEESFVKMRDKRDDVLRELHAKSAALEQSNHFLEKETFMRQKYGNQLYAAEAALDRARALAVELRASINAPSPFPMTAGTIYIVLRIADQIDAALASGGAA